MRLLFTLCLNMSASAENVHNLVTYLRLSCNSSLSGVLSEVNILSSSLKLSAACANGCEISNAEPFCKTGGDPAALAQLCLLAVSA